MSKRGEENTLDERKNRDVNFPLIVGQQTVKELGVKIVHVWAGGAYRGERLRQWSKGKTSEKQRGGERLRAQRAVRSQRGSNDAVSITNSIVQEALVVLGCTLKKDMSLGVPGLES